MRDNIPKIWKNAYFAIVAWYAINYSIITITFFFQEGEKKFYHLLNGLYLFEALCILVILIFLWSDLLYKFKPTFQVIGHILGLFFNFMVMGSFSYFLSEYQEGDIYIEDWQAVILQMQHEGEALRYHNQYIITVSVYYIIRYIESLQNKEKEKSILALKNKEMQLSLLKSQINPHFLFNTLNSISTLIHFDKDKARLMISQLSSVFRYALETSTDQLIVLRSELKFIDNYIKIQKVRFEERLSYETVVEESCMDINIPPMVLQPLVENSVKYGIGPKDDGGTIRLTVKEIAGGIYFEVLDDGLGVNAVKVHDGNSTGIGLKNSNQRLQSIYGSSSELKIKASEDGYKVSFIISKEHLT